MARLTRKLFAELLNGHMMTKQMKIILRKKFAEATKPGQKVYKQFNCLHLSMPPTGGDTIYEQELSEIPGIDFNQLQYDEDDDVLYFTHGETERLETIGCLRHWNQITCSSCNKLLGDCDCDRCGRCGEVLLDDCNCDRCGDCGELIDDCDCEQCLQCGSLMTNCRCDRCRECTELVHNCDCDRCSKCHELEAECVCELSLVL